MARHAARERYDLVVIGPEGPLAAGVADALVTASVPVFGPGRAAARLETSKAFAKEMMVRAGVATAASATFHDAEAALAHARRQDQPPVVKADGLAAGKGVVVPDSLEAAEEAIHAQLAGSAAEGGVVLEERLEGREVSAFALVSGEAVVPLAAACDYKRLGDADAGPNTGGMGAYSPVPWFGNDALESAVAEVFEPIAWRMARDGTPYRGVLYAGLMLTAAWPDGAGVQRALRRSGGAGHPAAARRRAGQRHAGRGPRRARPDGRLGGAAIRARRWGWCSPRRAIRTHRRSDGR